MRGALLASTIALALAVASGVLAAHESHKSPPAARSAYAFQLPQPGSYRLPPIKAAAGGVVLDEEERRRDLGEVLRGRQTVLAFIYTRCGDICPTATLDMSRLQDLAAKDRLLAARFRLITMSFDPEHDTPAVMREHAGHWRSTDPGAPEWLFVTAPDPQALAPMLVAYNQPVSRKPEAAAVGGPLHHIFRAFLIDGEGLIRNIYSLDFFDPELVLNDVRTLLLEIESSGKPKADERPH